MVAVCSKKKGFRAGIRYYVCMVGLAVFCSGCVSISQTGKTPEEIVAERAVQRWNAIIAGDWKSAYSYTSPAYRDVIGLDGFIAQAKGVVRRKTAEVKSVTCVETSCDLVVKMGYELMQPGFGGMETEFTEKWIESGGQWYIHQGL